MEVGTEGEPTPFWITLYRPLLAHLKQQDPVAKLKERQKSSTGTDQQPRGSKYPGPFASQPLQKLDTANFWIMQKPRKAMLTTLNHRDHVPMYLQSAQRSSTDVDCQSAQLPTQWTHIPFDVGCHVARSRLRTWHSACVAVIYF